MSAFKEAQTTADTQTIQYFDCYAKGTKYSKWRSCFSKNSGRRHTTISLHSPTEGRHIEKQKNIGELKMQLDFFLENRKFIEENPDYLGRKKIISASQFESVCKVNGKLYKVIITTRRAIYDIDKFRYYALKEI